MNQATVMDNTNAFSFLMCETLSVFFFVCKIYSNPNGWKKLFGFVFAKERELPIPFKIMSIELH